MEKRVIMLDADQEQCHQFCQLLEKGHYAATPMHSIENLATCLCEGDCLAVIIDIDTVPVDNRTLRDLTIKYPGVYLFLLSQDRFHPELRDAICYHIYACINKPVDPDELFYWLRSIHENVSD